MGDKEWVENTVFRMYWEKIFKSVDKGEKENLSEVFKEGICLITHDNQLGGAWFKMSHTKPNIILVEAPIGYYQ